MFLGLEVMVPNPHPQVGSSLYRSVWTQAVWSRFCCLNSPYANKAAVTYMISE